MNNKISNQVHLTDGCVIESDYFYVATQLDDVDPSEVTHSRVSVFDNQSKTGNKWGYHDVKASIVAVAVKRTTSFEAGSLIALSKEGEVEFYSNVSGASVIEKIPEAGLRLGSLGYVTDIRAIGNSIFVCGYNDQVYQRQAGNWRTLTIAPLSHRHAAEDDYGVFNCIDGFSENDVYVVGWRGIVWHWNGTGWRKIDVPTDSDFKCVRCYGADEVWMCGDNGALMRGNAKTGFKEYSGIDDKKTFYSLAKFQNSIYLGSMEGLYVYSGSTIELVKSGLNPEIETFTIDAVESTLWSFGSKDIVSFDGTCWTRIDHPDNEPI